MRVALYLGLTVISVLLKYLSLRSEGQRKLSHSLTLLTCIREISGSNPGLNTVYPEILRDFPQFI